MIRRRMLAAGLAGWFALIGLAACGGGDDAAVETGGRNRGSGGTTQAGADMSAPGYVGLTKKDAIAKAEDEGRTWRITREDDEEFIVTFDYEPERLNFEIDDGKVTKATFG